MSQSANLFVDTSGWAAPITRDAAHAAEMEAFSRHIVTSGRPLVTTNYIITELVVLLTIRTRLSRPQLLQFVSQVKQVARIVHIDPDIDAEAWAMLEHHTDKAWSLVDAASFVVMRRLGLSEAFTSDHHFSQAGFIRVPTP